MTLMCEQVQPLHTKGPWHPQERVLVSALRATFSADDEQHRAGAMVGGAAYDQDSCPSDAVGEQHMPGGSHANSEEEPAGLPSGANEHGTSANSQIDKFLMGHPPSTTGPRAARELTPVASDSTGTPAAAQSSGRHRPQH